MLTTAVLLSSCGGWRVGRSTAEAVDSLAQDSLSTDSLDDDFSHVQVPKAADELFDDFIFNFAGNKKLQLERIVFPLKVVEHGRHSSIHRDKWKMEYFFMRQGYYTLLFDNE